MKWRKEGNLSTVEEGSRENVQRMLYMLSLHCLIEPKAADTQIWAMKTGKYPTFQRLLDTNSKWTSIPVDLEVYCGLPVKGWVIKIRGKQISDPILWWAFLDLCGFPGTNMQGKEPVCVSCTPVPCFIRPTTISHITDEVMERKLAFTGPQKRASWCRWQPHSTHPFSLWERKVGLEKWSWMNIIGWRYQIPLLLLG